MKKREVSQTEVLIYQSAHLAVFTFFTRHISVFCANGIVMNKNNYFLKAAMFFCIVFPAVKCLFVWYTFTFFLFLTSIYGPLIIDVIGQTTKHVFKAAGTLCLLFAMYHRKIMAEENGLMNCLVLSTTSPLSISQFYF